MSCEVCGDHRAPYVVSVDNEEVDLCTRDMTLTSLGNGGELRAPGT